jgi:hypothetical protein
MDRGELKQPDMVEDIFRMSRLFESSIRRARMSVSVSIGSVHTGLPMP